MVAASVWPNCESHKSHVALSSAGKPRMSGIEEDGPSSADCISHLLQATQIAPRITDRAYDQLNDSKQRKSPKVVAKLHEIRVKMYSLHLKM